MDKRTEGAIEHAKRLQAEATAGIANFITIEIEAGLVLCRVAKVREPGPLRQQALQNARAAYDSAEKWIEKLQLTHNGIDQFASEMKRLRFELDTLAQSDR